MSTPAPAPASASASATPTPDGFPVNQPLHIVLTGSSGSLGRATLLYLLSHPLSHRITSIDLVPLPPTLVSALTPAQCARMTHHQLNLLDYPALDALFRSVPQVDGLVHLGAIPDPLRHDARQVHGDNVVGGYNVIKTAIDHGVKRVVQASSVNAVGLSYTPDGRQEWEELPLTEDGPFVPMDPYALSKQINEIQALSLSRTHHTRIASLRFHMVVPALADGIARTQWSDLFSWVSHEASARACLLGLTSEGWAGHEAFYIVAPEVCWVPGQSKAFAGSEALEEGTMPGTLELIEACEGLRGKVHGIKTEWWAGEGRRRGVFDTSKAERLMGWRHDE